jgi:hypothetical protein
VPAYFATLGDGDGECVGVTAAKIWDRPLANIKGWEGEAVGVEQGDGESITVRCTVRFGCYWLWFLGRIILMHDKFFFVAPLAL